MMLTTGKDKVENGAWTIYPPRTGQKWMEILYWLSSDGGNREDFLKISYSE